MELERGEPDIQGRDVRILPMSTRIIQSIQGEHHFQACTEQAGREDEMFYRLGELVEQGVLSPDEAQQCYQEFIGE